VIFTDIVFFIAAIGALAGAAGVVLLRNPFYSVLSLVTHLFFLAVLFLLLRAQFLAAAQLIVYAGAVMVLYVFVVAYIGGAEEPLTPTVPGLRPLGILFAVCLLAELCIAVIGSGLKAIDSDGAHVASSFGAPSQIGSLLLNQFLIPFEAASYLLLIAAVGALVLARKRRGLEELPGEGGSPA
jgi:NADH:ubiquinone oxidoreductase subunit 6 (subunit J)